jgi:hypothetical protein
MKRYLIEYAADLPDVIEAESLEDAENEILNEIAIFEEVKMKKFKSPIRFIKSLFKENGK